MAICGIDKRAKSPGSYPGNRQFESGSPQLVGLTTIVYREIYKGVTLYTTPPLCGQFKQSDMSLSQKDRFQKRQANKSFFGNSYGKLGRQAHPGATA